MARKKITNFKKIDEVRLQPDGEKGFDGKIRLNLQETMLL